MQEKLGKRNSPETETKKGYSRHEQKPTWPPTLVPNLRKVRKKESQKLRKQMMRNERPTQSTPIDFGSRFGAIGGQWTIDPCITNILKALCTRLVRQKVDAKIGIEKSRF